MRQNDDRGINVSITEKVGAAVMILAVASAFIYGLHDKYFIEHDKGEREPMPKSSATVVWEVTDDNGGAHFVKADHFHEVLDALRKSEKFALEQETNGHQINSIKRLKGRVLSW